MRISRLRLCRTLHTKSYVRSPAGSALCNGCSHRTRDELNSPSRRRRTQIDQSSAAGGFAVPDAVVLGEGNGALGRLEIELVLELEHSGREIRQVVAQNVGELAVVEVGRRSASAPAPGTTISPGTPTTTELGGTGFTTTALAPIRLSSPTVMRTQDLGSGSHDDSVAQRWDGAYPSRVPCPRGSRRDRA